MKIKGFKISRRRTILFLTYVVMIMLTLVLRDTFSDFTNRNESDVANIKVADMNYNLVINGAQTTTLYVPANDETIANIIINSLNTVDSYYEVIYGVCPTEECTSLIETPSELYVEYSSRTTDSITEVIKADESKIVRLGITNNTSTGYYLKFGINAGYIHNTLTLEEQIVNEYNEEDKTIAAIINGEIYTTFPAEQGNYITEVICTTNGGSSNATGTVAWNGSKWVVNITGVDSGRTVCNVYFETPAPKEWYTAPEGTLLHAIKQNSQLNPSPPTIPGREIAETNEGLLAAPDDYGTSYYFRGAVENNYVEFANKCWRIVRIIGDGSIKLVLYNDNPNNVSDKPCEVEDPTVAFARWRTGTDSTPYTTAFNNSINYNAYVGFMYGTPGGGSYADEHANSTPSTILQALQSWYNANSLSTYASYLADSIWCNDKSVDTVYVYGTTNGFGTHQTGYSARGRIYAGGNYATQANPTLVCPDDSNGGNLSRFTVTIIGDNENKGNGALTYPIGLLTADEVAFAGGRYGTQNQNYYLNKNASYFWWTSSPCYFRSNAGVWYVNGAGSLYNDKVYYSYALRPAVSLISATRVTGTGSAIDPFTVIAVE